MTERRASARTPDANPPDGVPPALPPGAQSWGSRRRSLTLLAVLALAALGTMVVAVTLVTMFEHKQEARSPYLRLVELDETSTDAAPWGRNWPRHFEQYRATAGDLYYGGSSAMPASKLEQYPWLKRLYAGYAFSIDYREARGHAYMLYDQVVTERVTQRPQAGACLHCHAATTVLYRKVGLEAMGRPADARALGADFDMAAVTRGFRELSTRPYHEVLALLTQVPDGTPDPAAPLLPSPPVRLPGAGAATRTDLAMDQAHPVGCIDCHDPRTMAVRITRPGFMQGIAALAASDAPVPHLASVEQWRRGSRRQPYDPNALATRQEMRAFVCGQCHVEYYCASKDTLTFPWGRGLKVEQLEQFWDERRFPDGSPFRDFVHGETGTPLYKAQHPEFELWSQGIHARAQVACADCHMPYERAGAMKLSNHTVRSPMDNVNGACQTCHHVPEADLRERVATIQGRTVALRDRAAVAMTQMLDAILAAKAAGATDPQLAEAAGYQRQAMWRLDFISSENSRGFHADQEAARVLAESIDYSRQAERLALRLVAQRPGAASRDAQP